MRRRKPNLDAIGARVFCMIPMDLLRVRAYQRVAGPFATLADPAGRACAIYGVRKQLVVHDKWVNAPAVFVIDGRGTITCSHIGRAFGDRPTADTIVQEARRVR